MPRTIPQSQVMQSTGDCHHQIAEGCLPVAQFVLDDPTALDTAHRVLDAHLLARYAPVLGFLLGCQLSTTWLLGRLLNHDSLRGEALKSHVLIQHTARWKNVHFFIHKRFVMPFSGIRLTQEADLAVVIDHQNVLDGMALLLAAVILSLFVRIYRALDWAFGAIMIKKGMPSSSEVSLLAMALASRAGMTSRLCSA